MRRIFRSESMHYLLSVKAHLGIWASGNLGTLELDLETGNEMEGKKSKIIIESFQNLTVSGLSGSRTRDLSHPKRESCH